MGIYLVDYENVHNDGVTDIQKLSASDRVVIFYGDSIKSIPFETHVEMMASKAAIEYIETHKVAKNYLDFQLATYLGFLIGKGEKGPVYIISQDTGFDSIVDFWRGRNIEAFRQPSIASPSTPKDVSLKKGTSTKKKKKKSDHVPKESKKETKEVKETKEIVEKKKPEKKKLPEVLALKTVRGGLCDCARNEMLYRGIRCGEPLICTDPKGKLYSMTYKMAKEHNYIVREFNLNQRP